VFLDQPEKDLLVEIAVESRKTLHGNDFVRPFLKVIEERLVLGSDHNDRQG